ncbi:transmembrane protein 131 homolog [Lutzomyia longipalpis]|uniref:transmembrane protein 131 homolog n=1 Tax=Lutzomyia longipalpis TaxID=7200 RepID=UPI002483B49F|nr:transmembrane protein 131 homolog [Lutzomyia longipalpis]
MFLIIGLCILTTVRSSLGTSAPDAADLPGGFDRSNPLVLEDLVDEALPEVQKHLVSSPSILDFGDQSLGSPQTRLVTLMNNNNNRSVFLDAIVTTADGDTGVFFTSFVEKVILPLSNITFNVVFLPKRHGYVATDLLIHTTFGLFKYPVRGRGIECPYRLVPLVGIKAPFNATISPEIHLFNPHDRPIQIVEIFSSGGHFQLELPSGGNEGPQVLWEIPPLCSKPIIRVKFVGITPGNYTAYVRIKITGQDTQLAEKVLVVPIEVEVGRERGIYSPQSLLNLGLHGSTDRVSVFRVNLLHSEAERVSGVKVTNLRGDNEITNRSLSLQIDEDARQQWLVVEVNWAKVWSPYLMGNIVISTEENGEPQLQYYMPIFGLLLNGSAQHSGNITILLSNKSNLAKIHEYTFTNKFTVPLMVTSVSVAEGIGTHHLRLMDFNKVLLAPDDSVTLFRVQFVNYTLPLPRNFSVLSEIRVVTNATIYTIPVYCFTGFLRRVVPVYDGVNTMHDDEGALDFGTVPVSTSFDSNIAFVNENPVTVSIKGWTGKLTSSASYSIILLGCSDGASFANLAICSELEPRQWMVFQITVKSYGVGNYTGQLIVNTDYEEIVTPIYMTAEMGGLALDQELLNFKDCFPEKICSLNLSAHSTFMKPMQVEAISVIDGIINYEYATDEDVLPEIPPNVITNIGRLYFDPKGLCGEYCYTGSQVSNKIHPKKSSSLVNYSHYTKLDKDVLAFRIKSFYKMRSSIQSIPFKLSTSQIKRYDFVASVNFVWPHLVVEQVEFEATQIGHDTVKFITVENPSDQLLITQYFLHDSQVHGHDVELPPEVITPCPTCVLAKEKLFAFHSFFSTSSTLENYFDHIPPRGNSKVAIRFQSPRPGIFSTLLFIRNNLTILEAVWLTAKAVVPQLKFGNRRPGSQTPLLFEFTDKHFKMCADEMADREKRFDENKEHAHEVPRAIITMKRSFTARNSGEVPIMIKAIRIGAELCEGYGFKVLNCSEFELVPNASRKIEISFTPDFTLSRITRPLILETNTGYPVNYTLLSTIPAEVVAMCHRALGRPWWESTLKQGTIVVAGLVLIGVIVVGFKESDGIMQAHLFGMLKVKVLQAPLDLKKINTKNPFGEESPAPTLSTNTQSTKTTNFLNMNTKKKLGKKIPVGEVNPLNFNTKFDLSMKSDHGKQDTSADKKEKGENRKYQTLETCEINSIMKSQKSLSPNSTVRNESKAPLKRSLTPPSPPQRELTRKDGREEELEEKQKTPQPLLKIVEVTPPVTRKCIKQTVKKTKSLPVTNNDASALPNLLPSLQTKIPETKILPSKLTLKEEVNTVERHLTPTIVEPPPSSPSPDVTSESQNGLLNEIIRPKRYGKTPGRERRSRVTKRNSITKPQYKASLISPAESASEQPISNIWDEKRASFSYVVAQNPPATPEMVPQEKISMDFGAFGESQATAPVDVPRSEPVLSSAAASSVWKVNDLGPIGTKKPTRTANSSWVDVDTIRKPLAQDNFNLEALTAAHSNSSFYSGSTSVLETYLMEKLQYAREKQMASNPGNFLYAKDTHQQKVEEPINDCEWNGGNFWNPPHAANGMGQQSQWVSQSPIRRPPPGLDFLQRNNSNSLFMNGVGANDENYNSMPTYELFSSPWEHEVTSNIWHRGGQNYHKKQQQ